MLLTINMFTIHKLQGYILLCLVLAVHSIPRPDFGAGGDHHAHHDHHVEHDDVDSYGAPQSPIPPDYNYTSSGSGSGEKKCRLERSDEERDECFLEPENCKNVCRDHKKEVKNSKREFIIV